MREGIHTKGLQSDVVKLRVESWVGWLIGQDLKRDTGEILAFKVIRLITRYQGDRAAFGGHKALTKTFRHFDGKSA